MIGPSGVGKSFLASALAQKACRDGYSALIYGPPPCFANWPWQSDGSLRHFLARLGRIEVLVIDDWAMAPLNESERRERETVRIVIRLVPPSSLPSSRSRAGTSRSEIPPSLTASSTV